jgi:hypothetical protein
MTEGASRTTTEGREARRSSVDGVHVRKNKRRAVSLHVGKA